ncbi:hypothetical protein [Actinomadura parmotrematis]|uniref:Secreted protein n=1 Tax=Actinomadura parmotrematis TaxID=2864039 RepID=A0ABS7FRP5_9ACTN|nr:hypothetical protein [Actinomadura parmotrematis]MBW8482217.1 hypothetical protein [Actinomadura parmotrematis]
MTTGLDLPDVLPAVPPRPDRREVSTPVLLRAAAALAVVAALLFGTAAATGAAGTSGDTGRARTLAARAAAVSDLRVRLAAMDGALATALLTGTDHRGDGPGPRAAFATARAAAAADLQRLQGAASGERAVQRELDGLLDALLRYQDAAARTLLLDEQAAHAEGKAPPAVLAAYRGTVDLLNGTLMPATARLAGADALRLDDGTAAARTTAHRTVAFTVATGTGLVLALVLAQVALVRRQHRLANPPLIAATAVAVVLAVGAAASGAVAAHRLGEVRHERGHIARGLAAAREDAHAAEAAQARYLLDPQRRAESDAQYTAAWKRMLDSPVAGFAYWQLVEDAGDPGVWDADPYGAFSGEAGDVMRALRSSPEQPRALALLRGMAGTARAERAARLLADRGKEREAIEAQLRADDEAARRGQGAFPYDKALTDLLAEHHARVDGGLRSAAGLADGWTPPPLAGAVLVAALAVAGIRPRLAEYR